MKPLFVVTAVLEFVTGLALIAVPMRVYELLLGVALDVPTGQVIGRLAGAALVALSAACWSVRSEGVCRATRGLTAALLVYNAVAVLVLAHAGVGFGLSGVGLWPAVLAHVALGSWCVAVLWQRARSGLR